MARTETPEEVAQRVRQRLLRGSQVSFDALTPDELRAAQALLLSGEVEIVHSNCRPQLVARLKRTIVDH